jgi:hypothetical protein
MDTLARVCQADPEILLATPYHVVDVTDAASQDVERPCAPRGRSAPSGGLRSRARYPEHPNAKPIAEQI